MVRIRLRRVGAKRQPSYRIVVADRESPRDGRFLEVIGHYSPRTSPARIELEENRLYYWLKNGAQPSESVFRLLKTSGAWGRWERFKGGEALEVLLSEAKVSTPPADVRTRRDDLGPSRASKKSKAKEGEAETGAAEATASQAGA
ncbi:MAG: 30S ribosomal protein S16 [Chloroflexota bacterium]